MRNAGTLVISSCLQQRICEAVEPRRQTLGETTGFFFFFPRGSFAIFLLVGDIIYLNNTPSPPRHSSWRSANCHRKVNCSEFHPCKQSFAADTGVRVWRRRAPGQRPGRCHLFTLPLLPLNPVPPLGARDKRSGDGAEPGLGETRCHTVLGLPADPVTRFQLDKSEVSQLYARGATFFFFTPLLFKRPAEVGAVAELLYLRNHRLNAR